MDHIKSTFVIPALHIHSGYSIFKRIANLLLVVATLIICINLWLLQSHSENHWQSKQRNQLGNSLANYAANVITHTLVQKNIPLLNEQLNYLVADPFVNSVSIFDPKGRVLSNSEHGGSVVQSFKLKAITPLVMVRKLTHEQQTIGYLSLVLDQEKVLAAHTEYQQKVTEQTQWLMLLAVIVGIVLTRVFYKLKYRHVSTSTKPSETH